MAKKGKTNYINNPDFLQAMIEYKDKVAVAQEGDNPKPQVPTYIGECFMKIATRLSHKPNFINYSFRDEMICDGIENCMQYIDNFNPEKSNNPFAYFTQIIYFAFLRRIDKEKKQLYIKFKMSERVNFEQATSDRQDHDSGTNFNDAIKNDADSQEYIDNFIKSFEESRKNKNNKEKKAKA
tara:strand:- start:259 stop:801 length:543 start_codon:yes stop_codon:yes gene_type:complete